MEYHPSNRDVAQKCRFLDYIDIGEEPLAFLEMWQLYT